MDLFVRTTTLENFRRLVATSWGSEAELRSYIDSGQDDAAAKRWQMDAGTAWHKILARPEAHEREDPDGYFVYGHGDYTFHPDAVDEARAHIGPGVFEIWHSQAFDMGRHTVHVSGTADHYRGLYLRDFKTKFNTPDARDYEQSLQWRFYLVIHQAAVLQYDLFHFKTPKLGFCEYKGVKSFRFWPYQGLQDECRGWIDRFCGWADRAGLLEALSKPRRR
jgi:hypothetical protein